MFYAIPLLLEELTSKILTNDLLRRAAYGIWKKRIANKLEKSDSVKKSRSQRYGVIGGERPAQDLLQVNNLFVCLLTLVFTFSLQPTSITKIQYYIHTPHTTP